MIAAAAARRCAGAFARGHGAAATRGSTRCAGHVLRAPAAARRGAQRGLSEKAAPAPKASEGAPPPTTITFQQGARAAASGTIWIGIAGLVGVCGYFIARELVPTRMSPNSVFNSTFEAIREHPEVRSRLGDNIKAYGGDYNRRKEGRRNFVEHDQYRDLDGHKRVRVKFNLEGSRGKAVVYSEVAENMEKNEFSYIIFEQLHHGRREAVALQDNRPVLSRGEIQEKVVKRLKEAGAALYGHSSCQWTHRQLAELGEFADNLDVYMCDKSENEQRCKDAKLPGYPCWVFPGEQVPSFQSLEVLQDITTRL